MKYLWSFVFFAFFLWSAINPKDYFTWFLEIIPALLGFFILLVTFAQYRLTPLLYTLILLHCIILMIGGHYTYAEVPLFDHLFGSERNNYDKVGHFFQGFVPALIAREVIIRKGLVNGRHWRTLFIISICFAFSALYELIEWWVAIATGEHAEAFLGTQGYEWDTQSDMGLALIGAIISLSTLSAIHDKQLQKILSSK